VQYYRRVAFRKDAWLRALRGEVDLVHVAGVFAARARTVARDTLADFLGRTETTEVAKNLTRLVDGGMELAMVYSDNDSGLDLVNRLAKRAVAKLRARPNFRFHVIEGADHTFTPLWSQRALYEWLTEHIVTRF